uniref:Uncharacterized protein n=1 Tax=Anopheles atroparvus TaxID=41427 RepID=A0AAG5CT04_ANOAO
MLLQQLGEVPVTALSRILPHTGRAGQQTASTHQTTRQLFPSGWRPTDASVTHHHHTSTGLADVDDREVRKMGQDARHAETRQTRWHKERCSFYGRIFVHTTEGSPKDETKSSRTRRRYTHL